MEKNLSFQSKGAETYHSNLPMTMTAGIITDILSSCSRFGYFVFKQPRRMDYSTEGGYTDSCSANMSNGRGPFRYVDIHGLAERGSPGCVNAAGKASQEQ